MSNSASAIAETIDQKKDRDTNSDRQSIDQSGPLATDSMPAASLFEIVRRYASLSDLLRMFGALAVAAAMGVFLLDGVEVVNDLYRFLTMLGLTGALTIAGLMMSVILKEQRGSRVFISLGLLSVPVNFTVFGALIYSVAPIDAMVTSYPDFAHWTASASDITLAIVSGLAVIVPVVWLGYSVLARSARGWLSAALLLGSAVLVIPVRQELWAALLAMASGVSIWWFCLRNTKDSLALKTPEGKFGIALLFVAPVILVVRSLFLYEVSGILVLTLASGFYFYTRQLTAQRSERNMFTTVLMVLAAIASVFVSVSAGDVLNHYISGDIPMVAGVVCLLLLTLDMHLNSPNQQMSGKINTLMVAIATAALVSISIGSASATIAVLCAALLAVVAVIGYGNKHTALASISALGAVAIMVLNIESLWASVAQTGWWGIATGGALAIVAGSMIDRAGTVVEVKS